MSQEAKKNNHGPLLNQLAAEEYQALIESFAQAVWQTDATGTVIEDSPSWRAYTGQTLQQWLGQNWLSAIHPDDRSDALSQWQQAFAAETPFNAEFRLPSPHGGWRWTNVRARPIPGPDGSICKWVGLNIDITEKKRAEEVLGQSEDRFRAFVTATSDVVYWMSADWQQMHQLEGKSFLLDTSTTQSPTARSSWLEQYIPPQDQAQVQATIQEAIRARKPFELAHRVIQADGSVGWTFSRAIPILNEQGGIAEWFGTASNITEQKQAEDALAASEGKYRTLFDSMDEGLAINELVRNESGRVVDARYLELNPAHERQTGFDPNSTLGRLASEVSPDSYRSWLEIVERVVRTRQPESFEHFVPDIQRWFFVNVTPFGEVDRFVVFYQNITARKRADANLAFLAQTSVDFAPMTSAEDIMGHVAGRLANHLHLSRCHFAIVDEETDCIEVIYDWRRDPTMPGLLGTHRISDNLTEAARQQYSAGQLLVMNSVQTNPLVGTPPDVLKALGLGSLMDVPYLQNGRWRFLLTVGRLEASEWRDDEQELIRELAARIYLRIERARAEETLRESQGRLLAVFAALPVGVGFTDTQGALVLANHQMQRYLPTGTLPSSHEGRYSRWRSYHPDGVLVERNDFPGARALRGEQVVPGVDMRYTQDDGTDIWTYVTAVPIFNDEGQITGQVSVVTDIDALKRTQEVVRQSERRLQRIINVPGVGVLTFSHQGRLLSANDAFLATVGYSLDELTEGRFTWKDFTPPEYLEASLREFQRVLTTGLIGPYEKEYLCKDGTRVWMMFVGADMGDGTIVEYAIDISARKQAEQGLQESEKRLRLAIEATELGTWEWNLETDEVYWNEQHFRLFGMQPSPSGQPAKPMGSDAFFNHVHPNERERITKLLHKAIAEQTTYNVEFCAVREDGFLRWMSGYGRVVETDGEKPVRLSGVMFDITERRESEQSLRQSDERFHTLIQNLPDYAIFRIDPGGIITEWTEGAQRVKGYTAQEVIGQSIALLYTPEGLAAGELTNEMAQATQRGRAERESVRIRKGGERFWVNEIMTAIHDEAGQLIGFTKISRDITGRKAAEHALRDSQQRLQIVLDSIADHAIITTDPQNCITGWNPGAQQLFGYAAEEAIGQSLAIIFTPQDRAAGEPEAEQVTARREGHAPDERYHIRQDGSLLYVSGVLAPLYETDGELLGYVKVARDLTERRRMEQALREADRRKDEFLAMLAHELRNPLAPLRNGLQILSLTEGTNPDGALLLGLMTRQLNHLVRLVDDLLDVSRISQGKIELKRERLELGTLVGEAVEAVRPLYQTRGQTLDLELPTTPLLVDGDATRLAQVVTNLLTNGSRYTGGDGRVRITLESVQGEARLRVADNGIGLEAGQLEVIFELFVQVDNSVARSQGGLGLGLTLVKRLVELHGGRIEAHSAGLGQGSEFGVYLPLLKENKPQPTMNEATPQPTGEHPLLVIDDNADAALTLAMLLKLKGYKVHTRHSGQGGIEAAESLRPAAILLDLGMPELDGYQTCRLIRQQPWGKDVVVIALTGYGQDEDRQRTKEAGFDEHLIKPVDLAALTRLLEELYLSS